MIIGCAWPIDLIYDLDRELARKADGVPLKEFTVVSLTLLTFILYPYQASCLEDVDSNVYLPAKKIKISKPAQDKVLIGQSVSGQQSVGSANKNQPDLSPITLLKSGLKSFLRAQDFGPMIVTDRNSVTPHPNVVPLGYLQIESGSAISKFNRGGDFSTPETVLRLGTWRDGEVRFQVPNYFNITSGKGNAVGTSDIQISIKQEIERHLFNKKGVDFGVISGLTLPTGSLSLNNKRLSPFVQSILFYRRGQYTIGTSQSIFMPFELGDDDIIVENASRNLIYQPTVILYKHLQVGKKREERVDLWLEYAGLFPQKNRSIQLIDMGALIRPLRRHQIDVRIGFGVSKIAPRAILGLGYSWLPGKVIPFYKRAPEHTYRP